MTRSTAAASSDPLPSSDAGGVPPLAAGPRALALLSTWGLLFLAAPGVLTPAGLWPVALVALVPWALWNARPGPRAFLVEWCVAGLGSAALCAWSAYVWWVTLLFIALVPGLYHALSGVVLRRLAVRYPLSVAAPAAWVLFEVPRCVIDPPFAYGWMRLGTFAHDMPGLAGSARVIGVFGLSFVLASFAGGLAGLVLRRPRGFLLGFVPLIVASVLASSIPAPETVDGPRVLLIQPGIPQERKQEGMEPAELFASGRALTMRGLQELRARGEPEPDLIAWGETMLPVPAMEVGLEDALASGIESPGWTGLSITPALVQWARQREQAWVGGALFGEDSFDRLIPEGGSFLAGCETFGVQDGWIRRFNGVVLWDASGQRAGLAAKVHLVPGAESLAGLERLAWVRSSAQAVANYIPDLAAFERTSVLTLDARDGRASWRFGVTVCFDNVYDDVYTEPARRGPLDFHLVCSNEAWYRTSFELDQMMAFSRLIALQTGRSLVRATNAGVTTVLAPDGREVARLRVGGQDRMVEGTLAVTVPVPAEGARMPPYPRFEPLWLGLWIVGPLLLLLAATLGRRPRVRPKPV